MTSKAIINTTGKLLETIVVGLIIFLSIIVILAIAFRYSGSSLVWYDEVASVLLAWITYYGAALAALRRRHIGFSGLMLSLQLPLRKAMFLFSELIVYALFITMAWASWRVLDVMEGETLVSLEWVPLKLTQSVVPIGCTLFVIGQILSTPNAWQLMLSGKDEEAEEIQNEINKHS